MDIAAVILCGGKSSRMDGKNKAFLMYKERSFIETIINKFHGFPQIYISVDGKDKYHTLEYSLIEDEYKDIGPIGGIYSSLSYINEEYVFITSCDMPKITTEYIRCLCSKVNDNTTAVVVKDENGKVYPLGGIYSKKILPNIKSMINKRDCKLMHLLENIDTTVIELNSIGFENDVLINVNSENDYKLLIKSK